MVILTECLVGRKDIFYRNYVMTPHLRCRLFVEYYNKYAGPQNWIINHNNIFDWSEK